MEDYKGGVDDAQWWVVALQWVQCCCRVSHSFKQVTASQNCNCASTFLSLEKKSTLELEPNWSLITTSQTCHTACTFLSLEKNLAYNKSPIGRRSLLRKPATEPGKLLAWKRSLAQNWSQIGHWFLGRCLEKVFFFSSGKKIGSNQALLSALQTCYANRENFLRNWYLLKRPFLCCFEASVFS